MTCDGGIVFETTTRDGVAAGVVVDLDCPDADNTHKPTSMATTLKLFFMLN